MNTEPIDIPETQAVVVRDISGVNIEALLAKAIDAKSAVEVLERLMVMRKEARAEAAKEAFDRAMAAFQAECPIIHKTAQVCEKGSNSVRYRYAPLDAIVAQVKPLLQKHGLSHKENATVDPEWVTAICHVTHEQGHSEKSEFKVPIDPKAYMNAAQKFASALTFAKRYAFCSAFGILTGDADDDATATGEPKSERREFGSTGLQGRKPPQNAPQQAEATSGSGSPPTAPKPAPTPKASTGEPTIEYLEKLKIRLLEALGDQKELCQSFMRSIDWLMPNETIDALELRYVPVSKEQFDLLMAALHADEPEAPYPPNPVPLPPRKPKSAVKEATEKAIEAEEPAKPLDWWRSVIVPIPHKGQKRDEYLKNPETIGQLYDLRHGNDEEAEAARHRLWGFLEHYEPKGWTKRDGTEMPPSAADLQFKEALDACRAWHEANHPDEKI